MEVKAGSSISRIVRFLVLSLTLISLAPIYANTSWGAEKEVSAQILRTDTTWGSNGETLNVVGLVQIPKDVTLTIQAGATLNVSSGSFLVLGTLKIGGPQALTTAKLSYGWFNGGSYGSNIFFINTSIQGVACDDFYCAAGTLLSAGSLGTVIIQDSRISNFGCLLDTMDIYALEFSGNFTYRVGCFNWRSYKKAHTVTIRNNAFFNLGNIGGETAPFGEKQKYVLVGNYFENTSSRLDLTIPTADFDTEVSSNHFATPSNVDLRMCTARLCSNFSNNYWEGFTEEQELRTKANVVDGQTLISISQVITLAPLLTSRPVNTKAKLALISWKEAIAAAELKVKQEADAKAAADKAAAELKVKQEADAKAAADKAAAELKVKQEADAQAAADKAAAELKVKQEADAQAAADKAAADKAVQALKAKQIEDQIAAAEKFYADLKAKKEAAAKAAAAKKKTTITCVKGKLTKKVTAVKPVCPKGYKKK